MKLRTKLMLLLSVLSFGFAHSAKADNTVVVKVTATSVTASGKVCVGATIIVQNESGGPVQATVTDGNGTVIIDEVIPDGESRSGTLNEIGTGSACASDSALRVNDCVDFAIDTTCFRIPTLSEWGVVVMTLVLLAAGTIVFGRFRKRGTAVA